MLGDKIGEGSGRVTGVRALAGNKRVLSPGADTPELEISFQGTGQLLETAVTWMGSYPQIIKPGGVLYGEGSEVAFLTQGGGVCLWRGFGVGAPTGPGFSPSYGVCGAFLSVLTRSLPC